MDQDDNASSLVTRSDCNRTRRRKSSKKTATIPENNSVSDYSEDQTSPVNENKTRSSCANLMPIDAELIKKVDQLLDEIKIKVWDLSSVVLLSLILTFQAEKPITDGSIRATWIFLKYINIIVNLIWKFIVVTYYILNVIGHTIEWENILIKIL